MLRKKLKWYPIQPYPVVGGGTYNIPNIKRFLINPLGVTVTANVVGGNGGVTLLSPSENLHRNDLDFYVNEDATDAVIVLTAQRGSDIVRERLVLVVNRVSVAGEGEKGDTGVGEKGDTGVGEKGDTGEGEKGDTGDGEKGDTGESEKGDTGDDGADAPVPTITSSPRSDDGRGDGFDVIFDVDGVQTNATVLGGEDGEDGEGEKGDTGEGEKGDTGEGEKGDTGEGEKGDTGDTEKGDTGDDGADAPVPTITPTPRSDPGRGDGFDVIFDVDGVQTNATVLGGEDGEDGEGEKGDTGEGEKGDTGDGEKGDTGDGEKGDTGDGEKGDTGDTEKGDTGDDGATPIITPTPRSDPGRGDGFDVVFDVDGTITNATVFGGEDGEDGEGEKGDTGDGEKGDTGDGEKGDTGEGEKGDTGDGEKGDTGDGEKGDTGDGEKGDTGDGEKGDTGDTEKGDTGDDGATPIITPTPRSDPGRGGGFDVRFDVDGTITNATVFGGEDGEDGEGEKGDTGDGEKGDTGDGEKGDTGEGEKGDTGESEKGDTGDDGDTPTITVTPRSDSGRGDGFDIRFDVDGTSTNATVLGGEDGEGEKGDTGESEKGDTGEGEKGDTGEGEKGDTGESEKGDTGDDGDTPTITVTPRSDSGRGDGFDIRFDVDGTSTNATVLGGEDGEGEKGDTGDGEKGDTGDGEKGDTGDGEKGDTGDDGPPINNDVDSTSLTFGTLSDVGLTFFNNTLYVNKTKLREFLDIT